MNVLVTGANGFIGKEVLKFFIKEYPSISIYAVSNEKIELGGNFKTLNHVNHRIDFSQLLQCSFDVVIHLGGAVPVQSQGTSFYEGKRFFDNVLSTIDLIEALPKPPKTFVFASSVMVYKYTHMMIDEDSETNPLHLYGLSKLICEKLLTEWAHEKDVNLQILRIGQVYGAGEKSNLVIPSFIDRVINDEMIQIFTDGMERRSFIHVRDVAEMIGKAIFLDGSNVVNVAGAYSLSVLDLAEIVSRIGEKSGLIKILNRDISNRDFVYKCDKMHNLLGREKISFFDGISEEYYYRKNLRM